MYKLAFIAVSALARSGLMPLFAHFGLVVLIIHRWSQGKLMMAVSVAAFAFELAVAGFFPVAAELSLIVHAKIFNILEHLFPGRKVHLLLLAPRIGGTCQHLMDVLLHLQLSDDYARVDVVCVDYFIDLSHVVWVLVLVVAAGLIRDFLVLTIQTRHHKGSSKVDQVEFR